MAGTAKYDREAILALAQKHAGNVRAVAKELGCAESTVRLNLQAAGEKYGNAIGPPVPGATTLYKGDGEVVLQWVRGQDDLEQRIREAFAALKEAIPKAKPIAQTKANRSTDLLNLHIVTDYHLGMKSWNQETGEDWDLAIAEDLLVRWMTVAIQNAPPASVGVLAQLGDFLHWDGYDAVTPSSKHLLDADSRFQKLVRVAIRVLRQIVALMLRKYDRIHMIFADANHDPASGAWQREMFAAFYDPEPRITVDNSADTYYCLEHGKTSLFFHHGHKRKPAAVDDVFVAKFREVFGRTKYSYAHLGHLHHDLKLETNLMTVEQHRTMAAKDAYAARGGWMAGRGAPVITYSSRFGEVGRQVYTPEMV